MPTELLEIVLTWRCGGYLTFIESVIKNTIVKNKILNMYFFITTTSSRSVA